MENIIDYIKMESQQVFLMEYIYYKGDEQVYDNQKMSEMRLEIERNDIVKF